MAQQNKTDRPMTIQEAYEARPRLWWAYTLILLIVFSLLGWSGSAVVFKGFATKGVEVAIFLYETAIQEYKVSMRSNGAVDVSKIAVYYNGGGHVKAAGCTMQGSIHDVINNLTGHIARQLDGERRS